MLPKTLFSACLLLASLPWTAGAAELQWTLPYEAAAQRAKETGKPMLVFVGNPSDCKDCQEFFQAVCSQPEFIAFAGVNLICTQVPEVRSDSPEERWKKSRILEPLNIVNAHALILTNADGLRIGELSTRPTTIAAFIEDIRTIIAKAPREGRLK